MERLLAKASQKRFIAALLCVLMILSSVVAIPAVAEEGELAAQDAGVGYTSAPWEEDTKPVRYSIDDGTTWTYVENAATDTDANNSNGTGTALKIALAAITSGNAIIEVKNNISGAFNAWSKSYTISSAVNITIRGYSEEEVVIQRRMDAYSSMFVISGGATVKFENITLDGGSLDNATSKEELFLGSADIISVTSGSTSVSLKNSTLQNYKNNGTGSRGGAIYVANGGPSVTLENVTINNCVSKYAPAISSFKGQTTLNSVTITNCISETQPAIYLRTDSTNGFSGGSIAFSGKCTFENNLVGTDDTAVRSDINLPAQWSNETAPYAAAVNFNADFEGTIYIDENINGTVQSTGTAIATAASGVSPNAVFVTKAANAAYHKDGKLYLITPVNDSKFGTSEMWVDSSCYVRYKTADTWNYVAESTAGASLYNAITAIGTGTGTIEVRNNTDSTTDGINDYYESGTQKYHFNKTTTITIKGYDPTTTIHPTGNITNGSLIEATTASTSPTVTFENINVDGKHATFVSHKGLVYVTLGNFTFKNVTLKNATTTASSAAIFTSGATTSIILNGVTIEDCSTTSTAADSEKGVIYAQQRATITVAGTCNINGNVRAYDGEHLKIASDFVGTLNLCNGTTHGYGYAYVEGGVLPEGAILINAAYADCQHYVDGNIYKWFIPNDYSKKTVIDLEFTADPELVLQGAAVIKTESGKLQAANGSGYIELLNKDESAFDVSGTGALSVVIDANGDTYSVYSGTSILYYMDAGELVKAKGLTLPELNGKNVDTDNTTSVSVYMIADSDVEKAGFQTNSAMAAGENFDIRFVLAIDDIYMGNLSFNIAASLEGADYGDGYNTPNVTTVYSSITDYNGDNYTGGNKGKYLVTIVVNDIQVSDLTDGTVINFKITPIVDNEAQTAIEYNLVYTAKTDSTDATLVAAQ